MKRLIMLSGGSSVGKTSIIKQLVPLLNSRGARPAICKIDCIHTNDNLAYKKLGVPYCVGLAGDICPDHFLVSNLEEIIEWASQKNSDTILIETAGLCNRCSPATKHSISICVLDCSCGIDTPKKLGPMLTNADIILLTKTDMVSQAEREIFSYNIRKLNSRAKIMAIDALSGYGIEKLSQDILTRPLLSDYSLDTLRHSMPACVCSYCIGEMRIGKSYQQGVVEKICFEEDAL